MAEQYQAGKLEAVLDVAWARRAALHSDPQTDCYRLLHGHGEAAAGLVIERFASCVVIQQSGAADYPLAVIVAWLRARLDPAVIIHKGARFRGAKTPWGACLHGHMVAAEEVLVREAGLRFAVQPLAAQNTGLFLDARPVRAWLQEHAGGGIWLNTFAYTGSLGVAARAGGARGCVQVDLQRAQLARAARNHQLNGQQTDARDLLRADCLRLFRRSKRQLAGIILDPPPRLPGRRGADPQAWDELIAGAAPLLQPGGIVLCLLNRRGHRRAAWEAGLIATAQSAGVRLAIHWRGESGIDFVEADSDDKLRITALIRT
jgi:23S rRNA (cytosine1962-C5)-methyltransferase